MIHTMWAVTCWRFHNDSTKVGGLKYILSETALQWYNDIPAAAVPANLDALRDEYFAQIRTGKTRQEWKKV